MKAVLQYPDSADCRAALANVARAWLEISVVDGTDKAAFSQAMRDAEVLLHVLEPVTAEVIANSPRLRLIQNIGADLNTIDLNAARARGLAVTHLPGPGDQAVAELTPETLQYCLSIAIENCRRLAQREPLLHEVLPGQGQR